MKQIRKRLTYANVMSSIAVFLVLGGATAFAASELGKNTVGSKQLKKNAVAAAKIKNNAVTTPKLKNGAVTSDKIADGAVSGAKVNLATLGKVPSAANADTATNAINATNATNASKVDGQTVVRIFKTLEDGQVDQEIASIAGYRIVATCTADDKVEDLELIAPNGESDLKAQGNGNIGTTFDSDQGTGAELVLNEDQASSDENERGSVSFQAASAKGVVVSGQLGYNDPASFNSQGVCSFYGYAIANG